MKKHPRDLLKRLGFLPRETVTKEGKGKIHQKKCCYYWKQKH